MASELNTEPATTFAETAEGCADLTDQAWYCIRSHLKHEHIAAAHLRKISGVAAFDPRLRVLRSTRRGRVWFMESLFPNYVFARFDLESKLEMVRHTPSVKSVVRFGETVPTIPAEVIQTLQRDLEDLKSKVLTDSPNEGEEVEVTDGPLKGMKGPVTRVLPAKQRVEVLLDFMGRSMAAELSLELLLFRRREAVNLVLPEVEYA